MRRAVTLAVSLVVALTAAQTAAAGDGIRIGPYSGQLEPTRAVIGTGITVSGERAGRSAQPASTTSDAASGSVSLTSPPKGGAAADLPVYPTLASDSALLRNPAPFGPGTFWYQGGGNTACVYAAGSSPLCYTVTGAAAGPARPALDPGAVAAAVAERIELVPGRIEASPSAQRAGLTGADSWFWLDPAPQRRELSTSLGGKTVTVSAEPTVGWRFGDGAVVDAGPGVPYRAGPAPPEAVIHVYETRCLPGDRGRNPYVLSSCEADGYRVRAVVGWRITYVASGPVAARGVLPTRTTETSIAYAVSEARSFLLGGGGQ